MKKLLKRVVSTLLAVCLLCTVPAALAADRYAGHWAAEDLRAFAAAGYIDAGADPDAAMTRAQLNDVVRAIRGTANTGLSAYAASDEAVTRQEVFAAVAGTIGLTGGSVSALDAFVDGGSVSGANRAGVASMAAAGYVKGTGDDRLAPDRAITLAEGVTVLARVLDVMKSTFAVGGTVYSVSTSAGDLADAAQVGSTGVYYAVKTGQAAAGTLYGTADLKYADFYAGDVSSTEGFDAVTSATTSKYSIMAGILNDFVDETANADGYHIMGVKGVSVAVDAKTFVEASALAAAGKLEGKVYEQAAAVTLNADPAKAAAQYKTLQADGTYSATAFHVAATVTGAKAELQTGSNWGDYQINVTDPEGTTYLRNSREDEGFAVNSGIQGIILETESGLKVGMEYLQSIWVQPYEVSFNVEQINAGNGHISGWDNLAELSKLMGQTVKKITYIMPDSVYVYEFDGIYIKPAYTAAVAGAFDAAYGTFTFTTMPQGLRDAQVTVTYTVGAGRNSQRYSLYTGALAETLTLDRSAIPADSEGTYSVTVSSSNYADIKVEISTASAH